LHLKVKMNQLAVFRGHTYAVWCFTTWNNCLYSGSGDNTIRVWNEKHKCVDVLEGHTTTVSCLTTWNNQLYSGRGI